MRVRLGNVFKVKDKRVRNFKYNDVLIFTKCNIGSYKYALSIDGYSGYYDMYITFEEANKKIGEAIELGLLEWIDKEDNPYKGIGSKLRAYRKLRGLTQKQAGTAVGISADYLCKIEHNKKIPRTKTIKVLCNLYKVNTSDLLS